MLTEDSLNISKLSTFNQQFELRVNAWDRIKNVTNSKVLMKLMKFRLSEMLTCIKAYLFSDSKLKKTTQTHLFTS